MPARCRIARLTSMGFVSLVLSLLVVGCGGGEGGQQEEEERASEEPTQEEDLTKVKADRHYVGPVEGTEAFVGIAVREDTNELIAYVCDVRPEEEGANEEA